MKKWTKAEREEASRKGKERWAARKKRSTNAFTVPGDRPVSFVTGASAGSSGGPANASAFAAPEPQAMAIDVVRLIAHDVPADVIVKVVERILRP